MKRMAPFICFFALLFLASSFKAGSYTVKAEEHSSATEASNAPAQASRFDGDWSGTISSADGDDILVRIVIRGNVATQYFRGESGWSAIEPDKSSFLINRNNACLVWLNSGGVWSETQVYSLSYVSPTRLDVVWSRHVNNIREGGANETWNKVGTGSLRKS